MAVFHCDVTPPARVNGTSIQANIAISKMLPITSKCQNSSDANLLPPSSSKELLYDSKAPLFLVRLATMTKTARRGKAHTGKMIANIPIPHCHVVTLSTEVVKLPLIQVLI